MACSFLQFPQRLTWLSSFTVSDFFQAKNHACFVVYPPHFLKHMIEHKWYNSPSIHKYPHSSRIVNASICEFPWRKFRTQKNTSTNHPGCRYFFPTKLDQASLSLPGPNELLDQWLRFWKLRYNDVLPRPAWPRGFRWTELPSIVEIPQPLRFKKRPTFLKQNKSFY